MSEIDRLSGTMFVSLIPYLQEQVSTYGTMFCQSLPADIKNQKTLFIPLTKIITTGIKCP